MLEQLRSTVCLAKNKQLFLVHSLACTSWNNSNAHAVRAPPLLNPSLNGLKVIFAFADFRGTAAVGLLEIVEDGGPCKELSHWSAPLCNGERILQESSLISAKEAWNPRLVPLTKPSAWLQKALTESST